MKACRLSFFALAAWLAHGGQAFAQNVQVFETYPDQSKLLAKRDTGPSFSPGAPAGSPAFIITVDDSVTLQQMDGVGASLTDSAGADIWALSESRRSTLMVSLFDPAAGIGISMQRQPMGASDFSASGNYSYDDPPFGGDDPSLAYFSIKHDQAYLIPLLLRARAFNPGLKLLAAPWSPPAWMKTNGSMNGGNVRTDIFPSLAEYFGEVCAGLPAARSADLWLVDAERAAEFQQRLSLGLRIKLGRS